MLADGSLPKRLIILVGNAKAKCNCSSQDESNDEYVHLKESIKLLAQKSQIPTLSEY